MLVHEISGADQGIDARYVTRGVWGHASKCFLVFRALRELLVQSEANNYSTAIVSTENQDFMLWLIMLHEAKVYSYLGIQNSPLCHYLDLLLVFWWFCICSIL